MRFNVLFLFAAVVLLTSCKEAYRSIDPQKFNRQLHNDTSLKTAADLIRAYDTSPGAPAHGKAVVDVKQLDNNKQLITAITNITDDDELKASKTVMIAEYADSHWQVSEIRYSCKYRSGYGHEGWGI